MDKYTLLKLILVPWIFFWGLGFFVVINGGNGDGWSMGEGAFIENRVLAILVTFCCCYLALNVWFVLIPKWRGEKEPSEKRKTKKEKKEIRRSQSATRRKLTDKEKGAMVRSAANIFGFDPNESSEELSKKCEHCGFLNSASNNPGWASLLGMSSMLEGTAGCDISCINCGRNFWVSTKELTGSGPDVQFDSMPGIGDYMVNKMNKTAEERGDTARYELPSEMAERKNRKKSPKSEK
jgi:hypothetical protein